MYKFQLDFSDMTKDDIQRFIDSTSIFVEVDGDYKTKVRLDGTLEEFPVAINNGTGYLTGNVLNRSLSNSLGISEYDLYAVALDLYRKHNFSVELAGEELAESYVLE